MSVLRSTRTATAAAAAALVLLPAPVWAAEVAGTASGRINDVATQPGSASFLYSSTNLPAGIGLDPGSVQVQFQVAGEDPVDLTARVEPVGGQTDLPRQTAVMAVDVSGSLGDEGMAAVQGAARAFLDAVPETVEVGLVTFGDPAQVLVLPTTDRAAVREQIDLLDDNGDTALYDAVIKATELLPGEGSERILVLTDGQDEGSDNTLDQALAALQASTVSEVTAVGFGNASQDALGQLAAAGGGRVVDAGQTDELAGTFQAVAASIATDLVVTAEVPEDLAGRRGNIVVTAQAGSETLRSEAYTTLAAVQVTAEPSLAPSAEAAPAPLRELPSVDLQIGSPLLWAGLAGLFLALLAIAVVLVGLLSRRNTPEAQRRRSLAVYSMRGGGGKSPKLLERESAQATKLGNNAVARSAVEFAGRVVESRDATDRLARKLDAASVPLRPAEWVVLRVALPAAAGILLLLITGGNPLAMLVGVVLGVVGPVVYLSVKQARRRKAFLAIMPDTLALMASGLRAGYSMPQAMDSVVREGREPIRSEFNRALIEARLGVPAEDALEGIADRMDSQDFRWVVMAIRIQREVGGNLAELLDTVSKTLRERDRLRRMVSTLSAEGRLSAWILGLLPVAFCAYLLVVQPEYLAPLVSDPLGILLLVVALVVFGIGVLGLRWAIKVEI